MAEVIRFTDLHVDREPFLAWLKDQDAACNIPAEWPDEATWWADYMLSFTDFDSALTLEKEGSPIGMGMVLLPPYVKMRQMAPFILCIDPAFRRQGYGSKLFYELAHLAKYRYGVEVLSGESIAPSPAIPFMKKLGFVEFASFEKWFFIDGSYYPKVCMEKEISDD